MTGKEAIKTLYQEREFAYADKVNHKGKNWSSDINHYDNIGKCLKLLEKDLEVLEIIKDKRVNIILLHACSLVEDYNYELDRLYGSAFKNKQLNKQEFELLKECLENEI